ncbi:MAG: hypothetical protein M3Y65_18825 [Pseudomonadota bacterium]|nr:hypothetical protein [Pseudomonadota bacterium]
MNILYILFVLLVAGIFFAYYARQVHRITRKAASAELEALRFRRQSERLALVLKQFAPELFLQVNARSEMEWQQAIKNLDESALPVLYPLEASFTPISSASRQ